ncbi:MAG: CDP-alcohol phosphatidyltransferase family protein [Lachnospiraceae bacterium]|nr:CDP-alcohol phosphatidyltransferase family protein [Lachnospiraceae bacterium]
MKEKRFVGFYNPSVILTYTGVTFAFVSMFLAWNATEQTDFRWSIFFLMIAGLCDMFDGTVARLVKRTEQEKKFGIQLDSLCDIVCFGVTPATIAYMLYFGSEMRFLGLIAGLVLTICGVIRLAYFNVTEEERQAETNERREYYQGMPITASAIGVPVAYIAGRILGLIFGVTSVLPVFFSAFMLFVAFLYIFNFPVRKPHKKGMIIMIVCSLALFAGVLIV